MMSQGPRNVRRSDKCLSTTSMGVKRVNEYVLLKTIGTGATSKVVQCMKPSLNEEDDKIFAMKIIKRQFIASMMSELRALEKLNHPHIIELHEIIDDPNESSVYLVMELLNGGSLRDKLNKCAKENQ
jgi:serine/threonine protein kinase